MERDGHIQRVQVKTTTQRCASGTTVVQLDTRGGNRSSNSIKLFDPTACDLLYVLTGDGARYVIPTEVIRSRRSLSLGERMRPYRLRPAQVAD